MASENIKERKIYRVLIDELNRVWERIYFLTNARSVDADDGENLETKVGAIKGITTSTTVTENGWAADAKMVNESINTLKKSVSDGKSSIASAITAKGVTTSSDATYATMAANIRAISTTPKIVYLGNGYNFNVSGIAPNYKSLTVDNFVVDITIPQHTGSDHHYNNANLGVRARHEKFNITKSYDPNTGIFQITNYTFKMYLEERVDGNTTGHYDYFDNVTCNVKVIY